MKPEACKTVPTHLQHQLYITKCGMSSIRFQWMHQAYPSATSRYTKPTHQLPADTPGLPISYQQTHQAHPSATSGPSRPTHQLPAGTPGLPVAVILSLTGFIFGNLQSSMQLLDADFLVCQLLPVLQQVLLEAVDLMPLAGQLSTGIGRRLLIVLASVPGFMQCTLSFLQSLQV